MRNAAARKAKMAHATGKAILLAGACESKAFIRLSRNSLSETVLCSIGARDDANKKLSDQSSTDAAATLSQAIAGTPKVSAPTPTTTTAALAAPKESQPKGIAHLPSQQVPVETEEFHTTASTAGVLPAPQQEVEEVAEEEVQAPKSLMTAVTAVLLKHLPATTTACPFL